MSLFKLPGFVEIARRAGVCVTSFSPYTVSTGFAKPMHLLFDNLELATLCGRFKSRPLCLPRCGWKDCAHQVASSPLLARGGSAPVRCPPRLPCGGW